MIYDLNNGIIKHNIPYKKSYELWKGRLSDAEYQAIVDRLNEMIDDSIADHNGQGIVTSSWMPGPDWSGTPFDPIYWKACLQHFEYSAMCFGLFLWVTLKGRSEKWAFGRYEQDGIPIKGLTYFIVTEK